MTERPVSRLIAVLGLLLLGAVALGRLPLDYLPRQSFPELTVGLALSADHDPAQVARDWMEPIESAARSLGRVRGMGGEVRVDGAGLTVRFAPGVDPERKAARLASELDRLRRRLPPGSQLWAEPASQQEGELFAIVWLSGALDDTAARAAAEELRGVPGVRAVDLLGAGSEEVRVLLAAGTVDPWELAEAVSGEVGRSLQVPALGSTRRGDRRWPVFAGIAGPLDGALASLPIPSAGSAVPLGSLATLQARRLPPRAVVRFQGEPARALVVRRAHGASLLTVDRALRRRLDDLPGGAHGTVGWSEADPLRRLVRRLALAGLLATALAATLGAFLAGRRGALSLGLALPAALAAAANAFQLAGVPLDVTTLVALTLGIFGVLPCAAFRVTGRSGTRAWAATAALAIAAAAVVPAAVALASAELGPLLTQPARAFLLAVGAGMASICLLPLAQIRRRGPGREGRAGAAALRDPGTVLLLLVTAGYLGITLFGSALVPIPGDLQPDRGNLTLILRLPAGATLAETAAQAARAEKPLRKAEEVERVWSYTVPGVARVVAEIRPEHRRPGRLARLETRLRYELASFTALEIETGARTGSGRRSFLADLEDRAETDEEAVTYRVILRSADLETLRLGSDRLLQRLGTLKVKSWPVSAWSAPAIHLVLRPRPGTPPEDAAALAGRLARASGSPPTLALPGEDERFLTVVPAGTPGEPDQAVPQTADLLNRPLRLGDREVVPSSLLAAAEEVVPARVARQSGRFVLPVDIHLPYSSEVWRREARKVIDASFARLPLPPGCDLERPRLEPSLWEPERLRVLALALAIPLLLFAVAACRLDSLGRALAVLVPPALGLLAAAPLVATTLGQVDELTVFALAASLALTVPAAAQVAAAATAGPATGARLHRAARRHTAWILGSLPVLALALAAATLGMDPHEARWSLPLRSAALATAVSLGGATVLVPALLLAGARIRQRDRGEVHRRHHPPAWEEPGLPVLTVHRLTKIYGGRLPALQGVDFTLTPGITGLLGPNGAGKTTLLRILTGLLAPSRGAVLYRGVPISPENLGEYRRRIGFLPQELNAYPDFTAEEFLAHWAVERGLADPRARRSEIDRLLAAVGLAEHARRKVRDFSGGMRQRVGIARALLAAPPILIVDEPTTGLDVEARSRFRQILLEQAADRIVLFSTHIASDIEAAASRILLLHRGRLRFDGPPEELVARARGRVFAALVDDADLAAFGHRHRITSRVRVLEGIRVRAVARTGEPLDGDPVEPNLEEAYLAEVDLTP